MKDTETNPSPDAGVVSSPEESNSEIAATSSAGVNRKRKDDDKTIVSDEKYQFGTYSGDWDSNTKKPHGHGKWVKDGVLRYEGGWDQGQWSGQGTVYDEQGLRACSGPYLQGEPHGFATLYGEDGETVEQACYHLFGQEMPELQSEADFLLKEAEMKKEREKPKPTKTTSFSMTLTSSSPIMSAPIFGLFPRYEAVPAKMLQGGGFEDLEDHEIPTPINLEEGKTREDWITWVRTFYPKR